jgi:hypothetical protein
LEVKVVSRKPKNRTAKPKPNRGLKGKRTEQTASEAKQK